MKSIHFLNGKFVHENKLLISPRDLGYSRGYAVFDFLVTYKQRPFMLEKHIDRLFNSARAISLNLPWSKEEMSEWVLKTLEMNKTIKDEKVIRITVSGGSSFTLSPVSAPTIIITVDPNVPCSADDYKKGVTTLLVEFDRHLPFAKTNNYIEAVCIFSKIHQNIDEVIYYSNDVVHEGTRSNVFAVIEGSLVTPKANILEGVTRWVLLDIVKLPISIKEADFSVESLYRASEVFITATGKGIMPVTKINNYLVGDGKVGPVTKEVMYQYHTFVNSDLW